MSGEQISNFLDWFSDNFGDECWLDPDYTEKDIEDYINNEPVTREEVENEIKSCGGLWKSYYDLPEYVALSEYYEKNKNKLP